MPPQYIAASTSVDAGTTQACGQVEFSFISRLLSGILNLGPQALGCISLRSAPRILGSKARLNLGRTIICRTPLNWLLHLDVQLCCLAASRVFRPQAQKKKSSLSIQHRSHQSLFSTANTAKTFGARLRDLPGRAPTSIDRFLTEAVPC